MPERKMRAGHRDSVPETFESLEEFWKFWDAHSTGDYEGIMEDADVQVNLRSSRTYCAVAKDILVQVRTQARRQGVSAETLINLWLREKATEAARSQ